MWMRCCRCRELVEKEDAVTVSMKGVLFSDMSYVLCGLCARKIKELIEEEIVWNKSTEQSQ